MDLDIKAASTNPIAVGRSSYLAKLGVCLVGPRRPTTTGADGTRNLVSAHIVIEMIATPSYRHVVIRWISESDPYCQNLISYLKTLE